MGGQGYGAFVGARVFRELAYAYDVLLPTDVSVPSTRGNQPTVVSTVAKALCLAQPESATYCPLRDQKLEHHTLCYGNL
jgi:hypothetical protein